MNGAKRVLVFCLMTAILPAILIITPLYLRHSVFADITHPVAESDVLAIEEGVSSVFCESLSLRMNTSFNAFQLTGTPQIGHKRRHIRLKKSMTLPDDTLEYWGFYLLEGALVKLKVCSRYNGSRILVVRGEKILQTCGMLDNLQKYGARMDAEYNRVKVTYEKPAEVLGMVDKQAIDFNVAAEDMTEEEDKIRKRLELGKARQNKANSTRQNATFNTLLNTESENSIKLEDSRSQLKHHKKRHLRKKGERIRRLKKYLEEEERPKRGIAPLDAQIKHGGNAFSPPIPANDKGANSVSSFETDLLVCYDGKILLTRGFAPSDLCTDVDYLEQSDHMVTEHLVATSGYYYYIFYSDNDLVSNDIHAVFDIYKPTYRLADSSSGNECINQTECKFDIGFLSDETVIVEVPTRDGIEQEEDDITLLKSTCNPRMGVYVVFPILVLLLVLACAFL